MALNLITCQECQEIIGGGNKVCPQCGTPTPGNEPAPVVKKPKAPLPKLVSCEDCGGEVSRRAVTCPHCGAPRAVRSAILWEYTSVPISLKQGITQEELNNLGSEGWEISFLEVGGGNTTVIFKRPYKLCSECKTRVAVGVSHCGNCGSPVG